MVRSLVATLAVAGVVVGSVSACTPSTPMHSARPVTPSPTFSTPTPPPSALKGLKILLDPGHSGSLKNAGRQVPDGRGGMKDCNNSGTASLYGYPEHTFNWEVATRLQALLEAEGAIVTLSRTDDTSMGPCVDERGQMSAGQDVTVSIHGNGQTDTSMRGYFALVSSPPLNDAQGEPSLTLARALLTALGEAGFTQSTMTRDGMTYRSDIAGLNFATSPAVLMELGEMRNPEDAAMMESAQGQDRYAHALYQGLSTWAQQRTTTQAGTQQE